MKIDARNLRQKKSRPTLTLVIFLLLSIATTGCDNGSAKSTSLGPNSPQGKTEESTMNDSDSGTAKTNGDSGNGGQQEDARSLRKQISDAYEYAYSNGQTGAKNMWEWLAEAKDASVGVATGAAGSVTKKATDAKDWVVGDVQGIGAWEYTVVDGDSSKMVQQLNELGSQRWECFWVDRNPTTSGTAFYLKRPKGSIAGKIPISDVLKLIPAIGLGGGE